MKDKTIYSAMIKFLALETRWYKFGCQLLLVGLAYQDFPLTQGQKQVLQETVIFHVLEINSLAASDTPFKLI